MRQPAEATAQEDVERHTRLAALHSSVPTVRAAALIWLGTHAPDALTAAHAALLHDPEVAVRAAAAVAFRVSSDPALVNGARLVLRDLILGDHPARYAGLRAAATLASPFLAPRLLPFTHDPDPETRRLALLALAQIPPGLVAPALLARAAQAGIDDSVAAVREAARQLLVTCAKPGGAGSTTASGGDSVEVNHHNSP